MSREERNALRREKDTMRKASRSAYIREMMDDLEGKPEEVRRLTVFVSLLGLMNLANTFLLPTIPG